MTEREALQDLVSCDGWTYFKDHATVELQTRLQMVLNRASGAESAEDLGVALRGHIKGADVVRSVLAWPEERIAQLTRKEEPRE
jgi:hypothetical protein